MHHMQEMKNVWLSKGFPDNAFRIVSITGVIGWYFAKMRMTEGSVSVGTNPELT